MENKKDLVVTDGKQVEISQDAGPMAMATAFLQGGGNLESLEKMMDLQDRWEKGEAKKAFFSAMVSTQKEMPTVYEGRTNKQTNSTYAAYKDIVREAKPIYSKHGISISFYEEETEKTDYVKFCADVYHELGHCQKYSVSLPVDDKGPKGSAVKTKIHGIKSAMSYGRGILLCSVFNIPTNNDVDDDGNSAGIKHITEKQVSEITDMINEYIEDEADFLKWLGVESVETIPSNLYGKTISALKGLKK